MTQGDRPSRPTTQPVELADLFGPGDQLDHDRIAALESSTSDGRFRRPVEAEPVPPLPPVATRHISTRGAGVAGGVGGVMAILYTVDQALKTNGETFARLMAEAGPITGAALANSPVCVMLGLCAYWIAVRWREHQQRLTTRDAHATRQSRAQLQVLRLVAVATQRGGEDVGALRHELGDLSGRLDAAREEGLALRRHVDDRFATVDRRLENLDRT